MSYGSSRPFYAWSTCSMRDMTTQTAWQIQKLNGINLNVKWMLLFWGRLPAGKKVFYFKFEVLSFSVHFLHISVNFEEELLMWQNNFPNMNNMEFIKVEVGRERQRGRERKRERCITRIYNKIHKFSREIDFVSVVETNRTAAEIDPPPFPILPIREYAK